MDRSTYMRRVTIALGLAAGFVLLLVVLDRVSSVLLLIFGAVLAGILLNGLASRLADRTPVPYRWAVLGVALAVLAVLVGLGWLIGPQVADQFDQLGTRLPEAVGRVRGWLEEYAWGRALLRNTSSSAASSGADVVGRVTGVVSSAFSSLANFALVLIVGLYLAIEPKLYMGGLVCLVPSARRDRAREVLAALRKGLGWWLVGQFTAMAIVGVLTAVGLWLVGMPLALSLGLIAALLSFIPMLGPLLSFIPIVLVGMLSSPTMALYGLGVAVAVQLLESNAITPLIQKYAVSMPPALLLAGQLLLGALFGLLGVLLAAPLLVAVVILVQLLYVEDVLGEDVEALGEERG